MRVIASLRNSGGPLLPLRCPRCGPPNPPPSRVTFEAELATDSTPPGPCSDPGWRWRRNDPPAAAFGRQIAGLAIEVDECGRTSHPLKRFIGLHSAARPGSCQAIESRLVRQPHVWAQVTVTRYVLAVPRGPDRRRPASSSATRLAPTHSTIEVSRCGREPRSDASIQLAGDADGFISCRTKISAERGLGSTGC